MPSRNLSKTVVAARKPKFRGKKTKWEKRRIVKNHTRQTQGKKPLVEPLTIAPTAERNAALAKGRMVFYNGKERIELPLSKKECRLVGVYKAGSDIVTFRSEYLGEGRSRIPIIETYLLGKGPHGFSEIRSNSFIFRNPNLGHIIIPEPFRGRGLALKGVSKAERHVRATQGGEHTFEGLEYFKKIFIKLGYEDLGRVDKGFGGPLTSAKMKKAGKEQRRDDLEKFHRIEAIDPKTGKARLFTFKIKK